MKSLKSQLQHRWWVYMPRGEYKEYKQSPELEGHVILVVPNSRSINVSRMGMGNRSSCHVLVKDLHNGTFPLSPSGNFLKSTGVFWLSAMEALKAGSPSTDSQEKKKKNRFFLNIKAYFFSPEVWGVYLSSPKWNYFNPCFQLAIEFDVHSRYSTSLISSFTKMQIFTPSKAMMFSHHWPSPYN